MNRSSSALYMDRPAPAKHPAKTRVRAMQGTRPANPRKAAKTAVQPKTKKTSGSAVRTTVRPIAQVIARPHMRLSFRAAFFFFGALTLLMLIVYSNMRLTSIINENQSLTKELSQLKKEEAGLQNQIETKISLSDVEQYAVSELGMVKPDGDQILYIEMAGKDHAEIVGEKGFWHSIGDWFGTILTQTKTFFE